MHHEFEPLNGNVFKINRKEDCSVGLQIILLLLLKDRFSFKTEQHNRCRNFSYLMVKRWLNEYYSVLFNLILFFNGQGNI